MASILSVLPPVSRRSVSTVLRVLARQSCGCIALSVFCVVSSATLAADGMNSERAIQDPRGAARLCSAPESAIADRPANFDQNTFSRRPRLAMLEIEKQWRTNPQLASQPEMNLRRAGALLDSGDTAEALELLQGTDPGDGDRLAPHYANEYGRALANSSDYAGAIDWFDKASDTADRAGFATLRAHAALNALRARIDDQELVGFESSIQRALIAIAELPDAGARYARQVQLAGAIRRAVSELALSTRWLKQARQLAESALGWADQAGSQVMLEIVALGTLGAIAEVAAELDDALVQTRAALAKAEAIEALPHVVRLEWQRARVARAAGDRKESFQALERAVFLLEEYRSSLVKAGQREFRTLLEPVYRNYADLLLNRSSTSTEVADQVNLRKVRRLMESLKQAEVEDYFANACVARTSSDRTTGAVGEATLYPLIFADRLELILDVGGVLSQASVAVGRLELVRTVREFRLNLERPSAADSYLLQSQAIYDWLIAPIHAQLVDAGTLTLTVVPDGALRTIPFAALYSGSNFLIEEFALTTTPSVGLTAQARRSERPNIFAGGLTEAVQGFSKLPNVAREIDNLVVRHEASDLRNNKFQLAGVSARLSSNKNDIVHLATHGEISADHRESFLLTYDSRLRLSLLERLLSARGDAKLDLLVLSACKTAAGDDQAALGLAGVAVQSGANSAIASLWSIDDASTAELFDVFYAGLLGGRFSKAESLRQAQIALLRIAQFEHPRFWAPYLLIGSSV